MKKVYAFLADGMEEVEALMVIDLLRRTKNIQVVTVSIKEELLIESSHNIKLYADKNIGDIDFEEGDCIFLPGGMPGTTNLASCDRLMEQVVKYDKKGKLLSAICAAPSILGQLGIVNGKNATCYPGFEDMMTGACVDGRVVRDGNIITGKGLGVALEMGLEMITYLSDKNASDEIAEMIKYR